MISDEKSLELFENLLQIMDRLRGENGCPWDREQTRSTLKPYIIEEAYEVVEAIEEGVPATIREELGDLLFQVIFQARIGKERDEFSMGDILKVLKEKMVRRHPHVFGSTTVRNSREVLQNWEEIKKQEKNHKPKRSILSGTPRQLPSILKAQRIQEKAATVGFDWDNPEEILKKIEEEITELRSAVAEGYRPDVEHEVGDLLFSVINLSRFLKFDADDTLRKCTDRFISRFRNMESTSDSRGTTLSSLSPAELDNLWKLSKQRENSPD